MADGAGVAFVSELVGGVAVEGRTGAVVSGVAGCAGAAFVSELVGGVAVEGVVVSEGLVVWVKAPDEGRRTKSRTARDLANQEFLIRPTNCFKTLPLLWE
jgi:hypothetical protein